MLWATTLLHLTKELPISNKGACDIQKHILELIFFTSFNKLFFFRSILMQSLCTQGMKHEAVIRFRPPWD